MKSVLLFAMGSALSFSAIAQATPQTTAPGVSTSAYRVVVISRSVQAVNYEHRGGASEVDFAGTTLMPSADGKAKVRSKRGTMEVEAEFSDLKSPDTFGGEYLTYVLWAISPEGRPVNLGEVLVDSNQRGRLTATTDLQSFALIVTAEPYYAVHQPSNVVVLENALRADTRGTSEAVDTKYELLERGGYLPSGYKFDPVILNANLPLEFFEARNALRIAQSEGADTYATASYQHAVELMKNVDEFATSKHIDKKSLIAAAREEVQTAEDAREIAVKKIAAERQANEIQASNDATVKAQVQANEATRLQQQAQSDAATAQANAANAQADTARAQADMAASQAASTAAVDAAQADSAASQKASAAAISAAQAEAESSRVAAQQAIADKAAMRTQLSIQLNKILETRDSARGLIVSMSDVLFDTGRFTLKPGAREKLAKVAGILIAYPGLNIEVGGYTDNTGGDAMNQTLSENRATAVRTYLVEQGVSAASVTSKGFGNTMPVASNNNASGRQENRRVELLVSGDAIGSPANTTTGSLR